mmetsp:Transcript_52226/g.62902  ORF Transcript_52226/g.62902 Transcript_52226/m.62902 type:complete len:277 (+) Transcript_52226:50-880(+)|eukprot:CAMPEP_0172504434 /NCGR_PEP_ID=MMETSP1066-20121228/178776_1 /TAXON_ID=671091 /ORGANISM="Coscinodiscus wailesii, Strain CCMP2513" /LENGTH=276 /DNA_ID=CAMNT_0013280623 /DNA_START=40 /DNA_END=870 /DNA_ORIENTATION=+
MVVNSFLPPLLLFSVALQSECFITTNIVPRTPTTIPLRRKNTFSLQAGSKNFDRPQNEFSRTIQADGIIGSRYDHSLTISANEDELKALAERFKLPAISLLKAELVFRSDSASKKKGGHGDTIQASGTITSTLTQKCVRTNEHFTVNLSFDIFSVIRPISSRSSSSSKTIYDPDEAMLSELSRFDDKSKKNNKKERKRQKRTQRSNEAGLIDDFAIQQLQELMQDFDAEDDIIEDEGVCSGNTLDAGEFVAQLFRLKLDPYPKKPGSEPINLSFSG